MLVNKVTGDKGSVPVYYSCHISAVFVALVLNAIFFGNILFHPIVRSLGLLMKYSSGVLIRNFLVNRCMGNNEKGKTCCMSWVELMRNRNREPQRDYEVVI